MLTVNVHGSRVAQNTFVPEVALMHGKGMFIWKDVMKMLSLYEMFIKVSDMGQCDLNISKVNLITHCSDNTKHCTPS